MDRHCPKCKHNFSDSFDECVYCGSKLLEGTIEIEDDQAYKPIYKMKDAEILEKYADYRKRIEEQTGRKITDAEFLNGIKEARRDSLNLEANKYNMDIQNANANIPKCPTCGSMEIKMISGLSKAVSVAIWGIFSRKVHKQWHCNNCNSEW